MREHLILFYQKDFSRINNCASIQQRNSTCSDITVRLAIKQFSKNLSPVCWESPNENCSAYFQIAVIAIMIIVLILLYLFLYHRNLFFRAQQEIHSNEEPRKNSKANVVQEIPLEKFRKSQDESTEEKSYIFLLLQKMFAAFIQTFQYIFFQPFFYLISRNLITGIQVNGVFIIKIASGVFVLPFLLFLFLFTELHRLSFRFNDPDVMGMYPNKLSFYFSLFHLAILVLKIITETYGIPLAPTIFALIYYILLYWEGSIYRYHLNFQLQYVQNQLNIQLGLLYVLLTLKGLTSLSELYLIQFYLFFGPILLSITNQIFSRIERRVILFQRNQTCSGEELDWQLRFIYQHSQFIFLKKRESFNKTKTRMIQSLLIYNIISNHVYQCNGVSKISNSPCFCLDYFPQSIRKNQKADWDKYIKRQNSEDEESESQDKQVQLTEKEFQHFIFNYIKNEYEFFLKKRKIVQIEISLSYIYFIVEVLKIPTKAFYETLNLYKIASLNSLKNKKLIFQLLTTSKNQFNELVIRKDIKNQKYNHQVCFLLDKSMSIIIQNILTTVTLLKVWLEILINKKEDHTVVFNQGQQILGNIHLIEKQLNKMFIINPLSIEIESLYVFFYRYLNIHQKRNPEYKKNSKIANEFINSFNRVAFSKDSCIVGISFLHPIGRVVRFTNNFAIFCGVNDRSELNSVNINQFMPDLLARSHDQYLSNFIERGRMNIVNSEERFVLIKTREEFVIPVIAKIKLEDAYDDDFGASAILIRVNTPYHYILLNKYCLLEEISKKIFQVFKQMLKCTITQIKALDFLFLIPQLLSRWQQYSEEENGEEGFYLRDSNQLMNIQSEFDVSLILPKGQDLIEYLLRRKPPIKKHANKYFQQHIDHMKSYFLKLEDFDLFSLRVKIIPVVTLYENVYILEIQSIKQFKKMKLEEKLDKVKLIYNQIFPFQFRSNLVKQENKNEILKPIKENIDIANLEEFIAQEEDQMGDVISQNLSKILLTNTASNQMKQFSLSNQQIQNGTLCQISTPELPSFPIVPQTYNVIGLQQIQNSVSQDYTENSSPLQQGNNKNDNMDQHSISSAAIHQESFVKRGLIRQAIFEKHGQTHEIWLTIFRLGFLGLIILSSIIFFLLVKLNQNESNNSNLQNSGKFSELFDEYFIYTQCQLQIIDCKVQKLEILFEFSRSLENLTNFFSQPINFTSCVQQQTEEPILQYEISYLYNLMHEGLNEQDDSQLFLAENYFCFKDMFQIIDSKLQSQFTDKIVEDKGTLNICYIIGLVFILIFCGLLIPFELYQQRQKILIMRLFLTLNQQHLTSQYETLQQMVNFNQKCDFTSKEFLFEDVLDSSKSKFENNESKKFVKNTKINKNLNNQSNVFKKSFRDIQMKILATLFAMLLLQSYFSLSYFLYINDSETIDDKVQRILSINNFSSKFLQMCGEMRIVTTQNFYSNEILLNLFADQMVDGPLNNKLTSIWQSSIQGLAEENNLQAFSTRIFCEIFQTSDYENSNFSFEICSNIASLQTGFILVINGISDFYDELFNILRSNNKNQLLGSVQIQNDYPIIQVNSIFAIKALDQLKDDLINVDSGMKLYLQIIVFTFYAIILGLIHIYGLFYVKVQIFQSLEKAKRLLSLIPMETLLENAHVISFVQKQQLKKKY